MWVFRRYEFENEMVVVEKFSARHCKLQEMVVTIW